MGRFEVLEYLTTLRLTGDDEFRRYAEIHMGLRRSGVSLSYVSVWRTINSLFSDGLLEVEFESDGLQRSALFRARAPSGVHSSQLKRVNNILQVVEEKSGCGVSGGRRVVGARVGVGRGG